MAQFLSPDPFIQAPGNWYNYNRYGYCYNNPLMYNDPSGEIIGSLLAIWAGNYLINSVAYAINNNTSLKTAFKATPIVGGVGFSPTGFVTGQSNMGFSHPQLDAHLAVKNEMRVSRELDNFIAANRMGESITSGNLAYQNAMVSEGIRNSGNMGYPQVYSGTFSINLGYYENPESQFITTTGSISGFYNKFNQAISYDLLPTISKHWGTMPILKYAKFVPYLGIPADVLSIVGSLNNGFNYGWTSKHILDLSFSTIGLIPGYGDAASFLYMAAPDAYKFANKIWEVTIDGIYRTERWLPTIPFRYRK